LMNYINGLYVGVAPINVYEMQAIFLDAVKQIVLAENITSLQFDIVFDGVSYSPAPGTGVVAGDPNSYFYTTTDNILVQQIGQAS
jgi:hypothetical protein